jgi:DNA primase
MARFTRESVERVREAVDFVELVSARTELRRVGAHSYEGLCPFHDERSPSFAIEPERKLYYCFGCQASGDVFTYVRETEGVDFRGAVELLADRCGLVLELEAEDPGERERRDRRERLLGLLARTGAHYERCLWESSEAAGPREYLSARGLSEEILRRFQVGYAPGRFDHVLSFAHAAGFSDQELLAVGLAREDPKTGRLSDRFRGRIMFPLADLRGRVLGFGARATREDQRPKYLNSPESDIYHKGRNLYGGQLARAHATRAGQVVVCEGYTDVLALHQAGVEHAVGLMGTALTDEQLGELARMARTVLLALDADSSGEEAMLRAARGAAQRKLELRAVPLPAGSDPAELARTGGADAVDAALAGSVPFVRFHVQRILAQGEHSSAEGRDRSLERLRPLFAALAPSATRLELVRIVASSLQLPAPLAEQLLSAPPGRERGSGPPDLADDRGLRAGRSLERGEELERAFLALCIALPDDGARALAGLDLDEHFANRLLRRAAERLRSGGAFDGPAVAADLDPDSELARALAGLHVQASREPASAALLEAQHLQLRLTAIERQLQAARAGGDGAVPALAIRRAEAKEAFDRAYARTLEDRQPAG